MKRFTYQTLTAVAALCLFTAIPKSQAQVSFGIQIGSEPVCPYGYYDYPPYQCAPYGYYGPEWFSNGVFIGSGPWYHGHDHDFRGHVDRHYDPRYGYHGGYPARGEHGDWDRHHGTVENFQGRDMRSEHYQGNHGGAYQGGGRDGGAYQGGHDGGAYQGGGHQNGGHDGGAYQGGGHQNGGHDGGAYQGGGHQNGGHDGGAYQGGGRQHGGHDGGAYQGGGHQNGGHDNNGHDGGHENH